MVSVGAAVAVPVGPAVAVRVAGPVGPAVGMSVGVEVVASGRRGAGGAFDRASAKRALASFDAVAPGARDIFISNRPVCRRITAVSISAG